MRLFRKIQAISLVLAAALAIGGCSKSESYVNLLKQEEKATNWFLAKHTVALEIPADNNFIYGEDAPFYKMDEDGFVYMQVIRPGNPDNMAKKNDRIYFRYLRTNIKSMYEGLNPTPEGNANSLVQNGEYTASSFMFDNYDIEVSSRYGSGVQTPLKYLGIDCEVNLVLKSYNGFASEQSQCIPYLINLKYSKAEY